jgi:hypothetical protein
MVHTLREDVHECVCVCVCVCMYVSCGSKKLSPVADRGGLWSCEMLRIPHCLHNRRTVKCEIHAN